MRKTTLLSSSLVAQIFRLLSTPPQTWQVFKAACVVALIMAGITQPAHASTILELDSSHFKLEVIPISNGGQTTFLSRLTFMNMDMNNVVGLRGKMLLQTNLQADEIMVQSLGSTLEHIHFKAVPLQGAPKTLALIFDLSADQGRTAPEIVGEWTFSATTGASITTTQVMLDGIVAVEILEGCKVSPPSASTGLSEWIQDDTFVTAGWGWVSPSLAESTTGDIQVYPNPTAGPLWLQLGEGLPLPDQLRVCTPAGQVLQVIPVHAALCSIELHALPAGAYLLCGVRQGRLLYQRRFVKQ